MKQMTSQNENLDLRSGQTAMNYIGINEID